jgi:filamentous hemagglutinin family protein
MSRRRFAALVLAAATAAGDAHSQIVLDGKLGGPSGPISPAGGNYGIPSTLGLQVGANLFHSFSTFNLGAGLTATFSGPAGIAHVVARVTGSGPSSIDGTLRSTIPGADFWFINPRGIAFGPNALLDVPGSFHAATASYLRLGSGPAAGRFDASNPAASALTAAPPSAFGFLGAPAPITVRESLLAVADGKTLSLVGGDLALTGTSASAAVLYAPGGRVNLASVASAGEVAPAPAGIDATSPELGPIRMTDAIVRTAPVAPGAPGPVYIRGGSLVMERSDINVANLAFGPGAGVSIALTGEMTLKGGVIDAGAIGFGDAGDVAIDAGGVELSAGSVISASSLWFDLATSGVGRAGEISIAARGAITISGAGGLLDITGEGGPGRVTLTAASVVLNGGRIFSWTTGNQPGGTVIVDTGELAVLRGGRIVSAAEYDPFFVGTGSGGLIDITATGTVTVSGRGSALLSFTTDPGNGGEIRVRAGGIRIVNGGQISTASLDFAAPGVSGDAGSIWLSARGSIVVQGGSVSAIAQSANGGNLTLLAGDLIYVRHGRIANFAPDPARRGGDITIDPVFIVLDSGQIISFEQGSVPGTMTISGEFLLMQGDSLIDTTGNLVLRIDNPQADVGGLAVIPAVFFETRPLPAGACAKRTAGAGSSLVPGGRGGLPLGPGALAYADYGLAEPRAASAKAGALSLRFACSGS